MEAITCKKELIIEVPVDVVQREVDSVAGQFAKRARIPGFRPGHAPTSLVRRHFRDDIRSEVAQTLIPRFFQTAVKEQKWEVVAQPHFDDLKFEDDQPLTFKATFEIFPEFELQALQGTGGGRGAGGGYGRRRGQGRRGSARERGDFRSGH